MPDADPNDEICHRDKQYSKPANLTTHIQSAHPWAILSRSTGRLTHATERDTRRWYDMHFGDQNTKNEGGHSQFTSEHFQVIGKHSQPTRRAGERSDDADEEEMEEEEMEEGEEGEEMEGEEIEEEEMEGEEIEEEEMEIEEMEEEEVVEEEEVKVAVPCFKNKEPDLKKIVLQFLFQHSVNAGSRMILWKGGQDIDKSKDSGDSNMNSLIF
ncbi:hypothetical protein F4861DRAFT_544513 [Xylaria intraflava]|nr:hypothetical protein F4861DRAFT_544513 [Xylaria intraflava]